MNESSFSIGSMHFKLGKIDARKQFHIVRRVAPLLAEMLPVVKEIAKLKTQEAVSEDAKFEQIAQVISPLMTGLSKLSDVDADLVLMGLLNSVEYQQSQGNWAKVASGDMLMIQSFELPTLLQIAGRAFVFNLSGFFTALPHKS